jgi:hypothetical protein
VQSSAWIALFQRIPPAQQDILVLVTTARTEISIQNILRLEDDYVVLRGRLAGTTDSGRVYFVPYGHIDYLGFQKELKEAEVAALYDKSPPTADQPEPRPEELAATPVEGELPESAAGENSPTEAETQKSSDTAKPISRPSMPGKDALLERLRARTQAGSAKPPAHSS